MNLDRKSIIVAKNRKKSKSYHTDFAAEVLKQPKNSNAESTEKLLDDVTLTKRNSSYKAYRKPTLLKMVYNDKLPKWHCCCRLVLYISSFWSIYENLQVLFNFRGRTGKKFLGHYTFDVISVKANHISTRFVTIAKNFNTQKFVKIVAENMYAN